MVRLRTIGWLLAASAGLPTWAQSDTPSTEQMIEQLKLPKTRSMRNLIVAPVSVPTENSFAQPPTSAAPAIDPQLVQSTRPSLSLLIQFDFNSARVRPESKQSLSNLANALQSPALTESRFAVEGHTDARGSMESNLRLSQQRAQAVRQFLLARGIGENRLVAVGKGSTELVNSAQPYAPENRRVRIVNLD